MTDAIYADKTKIIAFVNQRINKSGRKSFCVSCPRHFGKSMATDMRAAYYNGGYDSVKLFIRKN